MFLSNRPPVSQVIKLRLQFSVDVVTCWSDFICRRKRPQGPHSRRDGVLRWCLCHMGTGISYNIHQIASPGGHIRPSSKASLRSGGFGLCWLSRDGGVSFCLVLLRAKQSPSQHRRPSAHTTDVIFLINPAVFGNRIVSGW